MGFEEEEEEDGLVIDEFKVGIARVEISEEMGTRVSGGSCGTFGSCGSSSMTRTQIQVLEELHRPQSRRVHIKRGHTRYRAHSNGILETLVANKISIAIG